MKKLIVGFLAAVLFAPAAAFAYVDCLENINGCTTTESKISALQNQIAQLTQILAQLIAKKSSTPAASAACFVPLYDLYIGRSDAETGGEVSKLQLWLKDTGYFPDAQGTGYYGEKTAAAVVKWQKAHGMDFVTTKSGVGKMTRAKMVESCANAVHVNILSNTPGGVGMWPVIEYGISGKLSEGAYIALVNETTGYAMLIGALSPQTVEIEKSIDFNHPPATDAGLYKVETGQYHIQLQYVSKTNISDILAKSSSFKVEKGTAQ